MVRISIDFDDCLNKYKDEIFNYLDKRFGLDNVELLLISSRKPEDKLEIIEFLKINNLEDKFNQVLTTGSYTNKLKYISLLDIDFHLDDDESVILFVDKYIEGTSGILVPYNI